MQMYIKISYYYWEKNEMFVETYSRTLLHYFIRKFPNNTSCLSKNHILLYKI